MNRYIDEKEFKYLLRRFELEIKEAMREKDKEQVEVHLVRQQIYQLVGIAINK